MKTHYTFSSLVKKVFLLIGIPFLLGVNLYASEPVRYLITGVQNCDVNGIYAQQGYYGENNWPYFKHEKANWFLYFNYFPAVEEKPFGGGYDPAYGYWELATSLGDYSYFSYRVDNVSFYVNPISDEWYAPGGGTLSIQLAEPYVNTVDATEIGSTVATLHAKVNSMDTNAHVYFVYGTSINYTQSVLARVTPINGSEEVEIIKEITGLLPNTTYYYRVEMSKQPSGSINGEGKTFQTTVSTDIEEVVDNQLAVYPNPATDGFYIESEESIQNLTVFDLNGRVVLTQPVMGKSFVHIHTLTDGVYIVKIQEKNAMLLKNTK
jgi:hypothetical protein